MVSPSGVDSVRVGLRRQAVSEYLTPTVFWPLPGSGTYDMVVTVKWHDKNTWSETTHLVPPW